MNPLEEFRGFNIDKIVIKAQLPDDEYIGWLQQLGLLHRRQICADCTLEKELRCFFSLK